MANDWTLTIDVGAGQVSTDYSTWANVVTAINADKANMLYCKIKQNGSPATLPTTFYELFLSATKVEEIVFEDVDTSSVSTMARMFRYCSSLETLNVNCWETGGVDNFQYIFDGCSSIVTLNLNHFDVSKASTSIGISGAFRNCSKLVYLNVNDWNTENVIGLWSTFMGCSSLSELNLNGWNTEKVYNMDHLFSGCSNLKTIYVGDGWSIDSVTNGTGTFVSCASLVGAIAYDPTKTDYTWANWVTGYLTYGTPPSPSKVKSINRVYRMNSPHQVRRMN